jgi:hypothetical protein
MMYVVSIVEAKSVKNGIVIDPGWFLTSVLLPFLVEQLGSTGSIVKLDQADRSLLQLAQSWNGK